MKKGIRMLAYVLLAVVLCLLGAIAWGWAMSFEPKPVEPVAVVSASDAPKLKAGQSLKVLSWNIQFLAGKGHVFFFDLPGNKGSEEWPAREDIERTLPEVVRIIQEENPDVILLQEVDDGAARTYGDDQLERILALLSKEYSQHTSAFYWKMPYVPHPRIHGSVGMKLSVISKYKLVSGMRYSLPQAPHPPIVRWFQFRRAMLEVRLPMEGGKDLVLMNSHLDAFLQDGLVKKQEVEFLDQHFASLDSTLWFFGGDMNLLPPGFYDRVPAEERAWFKPGVDVGPLYQKYGALPTLGMLNGPDSLLARTHFPNRPNAKGLDKTIDFMFYSRMLALDSFRIRQEDCMRISDHMPLIAVFRLPQ